MHIDYSIVICSYNPDERILSRCLEAVLHLDKKGLNIEVLLIDNNSKIKLSDVEYIKPYEEKLENFRIILEEKQGLTFARIAGIEAAIGNYIVFFDDDNEPDQKYLQELFALNSQYSNVAVWGPGTICVDFIDGIDAIIEENGKNAFQERHEAHITYANIRSWQSCYPYGTGMSVKTVFLKEYAVSVHEGLLTSVGRSGNSMSSGEDVQIVLQCLKKGAAAGVSPGLKVNHIIPAKRANYEYIKKLIFGACIGAGTCTIEVLPEYKQVLQNEIIDESKFTRRVLKGYYRLYLKKDKNKMFDFVRYVAFNSGIYLALGKPIPKRIHSIIKKLKLD